MPTQPTSSGYAPEARGILGAQEAWTARAGLKPRNLSLLYLFNFMQKKTKTRKLDTLLSQVLGFITCVLQLGFPF
jgi:hypothetical protein